MSMGAAAEAPAGLPLLHVVGRKDHGKTTLVLALLPALGARGLRVGTVKHTAHVHELDTPGKDSHRHREAGADPVAVVSGGMTAVYLPGLDPGRPYARIAPLFAGCDVVLVEGHLDGPGPKIEVWRAAAGGAPLAQDRRDIHALVTDDDLPSDPPPGATGARCPVWPRGDLAGLVDRLLTAGLVSSLVG